MKICLFHPRLLPPKDYGGVERVVLWLAKGLQERGHEVWVAALEGSVLPRGAHLLPMRPQQTSVHDLIRVLPAGIEVIHFMAPPEAGALNELPFPFVLTVHGNGKNGEIFPLNSVFLSANHARRHGATYFIYNGIDPGEYAFAPRRAKAPWALFLSKTSWSVKNVGGAIELCQKAKVPLVVAGGRRPLGARVRVALNSRMSWAGPVASEQKARLLAEARVLIFPILWPEPFGLVVVEALMSGTPVLASRLGSLPELVGPEVGELLPPPIDGPTGQIGDQWHQCLQKVFMNPSQAQPIWDPEVCRNWALKRFHYLKMAEAYENAYKKVTSGESLQSNAPVATDWNRWRES
ncbi:glycosyltransferase [Bdellovibrionota bacterium FG-1]